MTTHDPYRAGQKAYEAGETPPSMRPSGMPEAAWREWLRGWEYAAMAHAEKQAQEKDNAEGRE